MQIKYVENRGKLKEYYHFFSKVFYEDAKEFNEHYYPMFNAYSKIEEQYNKDNTLLIYIEECGNIVGCIGVKDVINNKATLDVLAVDKNCRGKGYASLLIKEIESRLVKTGVKEVSLGARFRACNVYLKNGYKPTLLVQVNDFATTDLIKENNIYDYEIVNEYQNDVCGAVFFKVDEVNASVINHFESNVATCHASYIFTKTLN
ncbi:MAG: GNAT family N-acetyltransferase [Bacilli bacterium]|nr:GNAT family N-acetyltransferase [Bacilli bacterium]